MAVEVEEDHPADQELTEVKAKKRSRKKQLYETIRKQMEFYFSPANLSKSRIVAVKLQDEGSIDLSIFLTFNKIRALTTDLKDVVKALRKSTLLTVTDDMRVKPTVPPKAKENVDDCVIYVEQIPPDADHDWIRQFFTVYGDIDYVSLPRFAASQKNKGFAFIEFATPESAKKAVQEYQKAGCYLSTDRDPHELLSIVTHDEPPISIEPIKENVESSKKKKRGSNEEVISTKKKKLDETVEENEAPPERKKKLSDPVVETEAPTKKAKLSETVEEAEGPPKKKKKKNLREAVEETETEDEPKKMKSGETSVEIEAAKDEPLDDQRSVDEPSCDESRKKKNRKKKKKKKEKITAEITGLQILSKKDWRNLRNKYLNTQRDKMRLLKRHLSQTKRKTDEAKHKNCLPLNSTEEPEKTVSTIPSEFTPGILVRIFYGEPIFEVKQFKREITEMSPEVKYIDVKEGKSEITVRFANSQAAEQFRTKAPWDHVEVLKGKDELSYWEVIQRDREEKLSKPKKERGRTKLLRKAEKVLGKHIIFDDL